MECFNTGFPCHHQFNIALRHPGLKLLFAERWFVQYENLVKADYTLKNIKKEEPDS